MMLIGHVVEVDNRLGREDSQSRDQMLLSTMKISRTAVTRTVYIGDCL